jgi:two-component system, NtrC family, sensor histidine kinase GlrK
MDTVAATFQLAIRPRSILQLTVVGFLAVAGLLIVALVITADQFDGLSSRSQRVVNQSVAAMRAGRMLIEQTTALERNQRQYAVLGDKELLGVYAERRNTFIEAARQLRSLEAAASIDHELARLLAQEQRAYDWMTLASDADPETVDFPDLLSTAHTISAEIDRWTNAELAAIRQEAVTTRRLLTLQAVVLVGTALLLAAVFTALITRPLSQINRAISQLGSGTISGPVAIHGPRDLVRLGERLDWLRERLDTLEHQRSSVLRHVSHELKTPLAAIQESSALLSEGVVGDLNIQQRDILRIQRNNCQRLLALINDLLRYNADSFGVLNTMPEAVSLDVLIAQVAASHELALRARRLELMLQLAPLVVTGNPEQLRVVIDNLLSNAIKYSPEGAHIMLELSLADSVVLLDVKDEGPGVAAEEREKIFQPFYQGNQPSRDFCQGSGLGLAIAEEYARANGGSLEVVPASHGGHFRLVLGRSTKGN